MQNVYEYIWLDHDGNFRSKTKVCKKELSVTNIMPGLWNFDGSSTEQANGSDSEVYIRPVSVYRDPFRKNLFRKCYLVLCDTWLPNNLPHPDNNRPDALQIFENEKVRNEETMFGLEQEFFFTNGKGVNPVPLGMYKSGVDSYSGESGPQGPYYCGVGAGKVFGRKIDC